MDDAPAVVRDLTARRWHDVSYRRRRCGSGKEEYTSPSPERTRDNGEIQPHRVAISPTGTELDLAPWGFRGGPRFSFRAGRCILPCGVHEALMWQRFSPLLVPQSMFFTAHPPCYATGNNDDEDKAANMTPTATMEAGRRRIAHANCEVVRRGELRCIRSTSTYILYC